MLGTQVLVFDLIFARYGTVLDTGKWITNSHSQKCSKTDKIGMYLDTVT